jgi:hypothetical protein
VRPQRDVVDADHLAGGSRRGGRESGDVTERPLARGSSPPSRFWSQPRLESADLDRVVSVGVLVVGTSVQDLGDGRPSVQKREVADEPCELDHDTTINISPCQSLCTRERTKTDGVYQPESKRWARHRMSAFLGTCSLRPPHAVTGLVKKRTEVDHTRRVMIFGTTSPLSPPQNAPWAGC